MCLCWDVRNLRGSHNLKTPERTNATPGLTDKAQAHRLGFFRRIASSRNGLRSRPTRLPLSARVARHRQAAARGHFRPTFPQSLWFSAHNPSPGYYVVGLPIAIRKGTFRLGRGNEHEKGCHFHTIWRRLVAWQPEKILHPWECRGLVWSPKQPRPTQAAWYYSRTSAVSIRQHKTADEVFS